LENSKIQNVRHYGLGYSSWIAQGIGKGTTLKTALPCPQISTSNSNLQSLSCMENKNSSIFPQEKSEKGWFITLFTDVDGFPFALPPPKVEPSSMATCYVYINLKK